MTKPLFLLLSLFSFLSPLRAASVTVAPIFTSDMVLQRERIVPVWGTAAAGTAVTVRFQGQRIRVKADTRGHWRADLKPMAANAIGQTLTIATRDTTISYGGVLVGEVWLCSGQSNMKYRMRLEHGMKHAARGRDLCADELSAPAPKLLRLFVYRPQKREPGTCTWSQAEGEPRALSSAAAYFFGKRLAKELQVPVGIITTAIGGTRIEAWTSRQAYLDSERFSEELAENDYRIDGQAAGVLYKTMVQPLAPMAVRGFLWYQGESNLTDLGHDPRYADKQRVLTESWRAAFENSDAPFYYVLLAPHTYTMRTPKRGRTPSTAEALPLFWQQQENVAGRVKHTNYACVWDLVDDVRDIHPSYKWTLADRLARLALHNDYGRDTLETSGPRAIAAMVAPTGGASASGHRKSSVCDSLIVTFAHVAGGLASRDGKRLSWFEVAGDDGVWRAALADIVATDRLRVFSPFVAHPTAVRLGWHETAQPNLENTAHLPATPFVLRAGVQQVTK